MKKALLILLCAMLAMSFSISGYAASSTNNKNQFLCHCKYCDRDIYNCYSHICGNYFVYIPGDADDNGIIDADDYIEAKRVSMGQSKSAVKCISSAGVPTGFKSDSYSWLVNDANCDGKVTVEDYILLKRICFGMSAKTICRVPMK